MYIRILTVSIIASIFLMTGCSTTQNKAFAPEKKWNGNIVSASYSMASELEYNLKHPISQQDSIIVASFVNVNDLTKSSSFGRMMAEQVGSRLSQKGYKVIEMKLRQDSIFVDSENKGEFLLSRNLKDVSRNHNVSAVVVGTYAEAHHKVYITARIVNPETSVILSSCDYELRFPNYREMAVLMQK